MEEISLTDFDQLNWVEHVGDYASSCGYCHGSEKSINMVTLFCSLQSLPFHPETGHLVQQAIETHFEAVQMGCRGC